MRFLTCLLLLILFGLMQQTMPIATSQTIVYISDSQATPTMLRKYWNERKKVLRTSKAG